MRAHAHWQDVSEKAGSPRTTVPATNASSAGAVSASPTAAALTPARARMTRRGEQPACDTRDLSSPC